MKRKTNKKITTNKLKNPLKMITTTKRKKNINKTNHNHLTRNHVKENEKHTYKTKQEYCIRFY